MKTESLVALTLVGAAAVLVYKATRPGVAKAAPYAAYGAVKPQNAVEAVFSGADKTFGNALSLSPLWSLGVAL